MVEIKQLRDTILFERRELDQEMYFAFHIEDI